jgi:hypothetical protein
VLYTNAVWRVFFVHFKCWLNAFSRQLGLMQLQTLISDPSICLLPYKAMAPCVKPCHHPGIISYLLNDNQPGQPTSVLFFLDLGMATRFSSNVVKMFQKLDPSL